MVLFEHQKVLNLEIRKKWVSNKIYEHFGYLLMLDKFALILEVLE
jgi:hypothetical protein